MASALLSSYETQHMILGFGLYDWLDIFGLRCVCQDALYPSAPLWHQRRENIDRSDPSRGRSPKIMRQSMF